MSQAGLSYLELVAALAVLGGVLALAAPALPRPRSGPEAAARALAGLLQRGRLHAARTGAGSSVEVDLGTGEVRVWTAAPGGSDSLVVTGRVPLRDSIILVGHADAPRAGFRFDPLGRATGGPIHVCGRSNERTVTADPWTGRIDVAIP